MEINLKTKSVTKCFALIVAILISIHIVLQILDLYFGHDYIFGLVPFLQVTHEGKIPTMYSTIALLFCSTLLALIAYAKKKTTAPFYLHWGSLALIFLYLAMDEALEVHEMLNKPVGTTLETSGAFSHAWVIPYGIGVILLALVFRKFILDLPAKTRFLFLTAGMVYVTGAIGMEMLHSAHTGFDGVKTLMDSVYSTTEEILEMGGIVIFIHALLSYISSEFRELNIKIS